MGSKAASHSQMHRVPFSQHQRQELLALGLGSKVLEYIEIEALPTARVFLKKPPRKNDVRNELRDLQLALTKAQDAIERLLDATPALPHLKAAQAVLTAGQGRHVMGGIRLNETSKSLTVSIKLIADGLEQMPPGPLRHRSADPYPVELIHDALQAGSIAESGDPDAHGVWPSASPTSAFRRLVGVCYEAIDAQFADPERAVKAYVKKWSALHKYLVSLGAVTERGRKT